MTKSRVYSLMPVCDALIGSLFLAMCAPLTALACDTVQTATVESTCVVIPPGGFLGGPLDGRAGGWVDLKTADRLRRLKLEVPELLLQVKKYGLIEKRREIQIQALMESVSLRREAADMLKVSIDHAVKSAREARQEAAEAREELAAWYRSPWLWGVTGAVLGGALMAYMASN